MNDCWCVMNDGFGGIRREGVESRAISKRRGICIAFGKI